MILVFVLGLIVGSFLNVLIYRLWADEEVVKTPSHCRNCGHELTWHELVPVFSYIWLGGKCAHCQAQISIQYPLVELATGLLFVLTVWRLWSGPPWSIVNGQWSLLLVNSYLPLVIVAFYLTLISLLIAMFVFDLKHYLLPNSLLYLAIGASTLAALLQPQSFLNHLLGAAVAAGFIGLLVVFTKERGMGSGDAYLAFSLGMLVSWPLTLVGIFLSFLFGSVIGGILMVAGKKKLKSKVPFGPFLISAFLLTFFVGQQILSWYFRIVGI